jgi:hypothetical protein
VPRASLQLNDFSGGLNTKSSPRDIAPNQVQLADNVILSNVGLVQSSKDADSKLTEFDKTTTGNHGNGAFIYNHDYDISDSSAPITQTATQIIAYPDGTDIEFLYRSYNTTGDFTDGDTSNAITMTGSATFEPVYYYVDGVLYIADKDRVDTSGSYTQKSIQLVSKDRFNQTVNAEWVSGDSGPSSTTDAIFEAIENETTVSLSTASAAGEFRLGFNSSPTQSSLSDFEATGEAVYLQADLSGTEYVSLVKVTTASGNDARSLFPDNTKIYLNGEIMVVSFSSALYDSSTGVTSFFANRGQFSTSIRSHIAGTDSTLQQSSDEPAGGGAWEEGVYEFSYTIVDYGGNETLPHVFSTALSDATIASGQFFDDVDIKFNTASAFRKNEKGVRIYTRIKDSNDRYILFLDVDYERGARRNLFEDFEAWHTSSTYGSAGNTAYLQNQLRILRPALDTYESINGYSQEEKSINLGDKGGYKAATICSRRAWIANVRKNDVVYDDRVYYSPVNQFATFPDSYYLDIGISDGDSFTGLHSLGNRVLAFKQKKLYIINVSSTSDAGWYLEAEYEGVGCRTQESVCKTPFGVCWVNDDGVYLFDGTSAPKELSLFLDDNTFRNNSGARPAIGYNSKYKQLVVCQDTSAEDDFLVYDFQTQGWSVTKSMTGGMSNFVQTSDGLYFIEYGSVNAKTVMLLTGDTGTNNIDLKTKDLDFGNPGLVKRVNRVFVTAKGSGTTLTLKYANDGETTFATATDGNPSVSLGTDYVIKEFIIGSADRNCESMAFELTADGGITINDINIDYRQTNKRPS